MRSKQQEAINLLLSKKRCALFLKPGSGKTYVCIEAIKRLELKKILVISTSLICKDTWPRELEKFNCDVELKTVTAHYKNLEKFNEQVDAVIIDESTLFKSTTSNRFKTLVRLLNHLAPKHVWILTGTPHPQSMVELWPQIYLLDGGKRLGSFNQFAQVYFRAPEYGKPLVLRKGAEQRIYALIEDICIVGEPPTSALPEVEYVKQDVQVSEELRKTYNFLIDNACLPGDPEVVELTDLIVNNAYIKLRQLVQGIAERYEDNYRVKELEKLSGKCIIYTKFIKEHKQIVDHFGDKCYSFNASDKIDKRSAALTAFENDPRENLFFIVPYQLVAHGLNIQNSADKIIWYSLPESLEYYLQANARLVRPGRSRGKVEIIHLVAKETIDENLFYRLKSREKVQQNLFEYFKKK